MSFNDILGSIRTVGSGLTNPVSNGVSAQLATVSIPSLTELNALATSQAALYSLPVPSAGVIQTAQTAMLNAVNSANNLIGHTNRISGVDLTGNGSLATIAKTINSARSLNGDKSCSTVLAAFGAIYKAAEMVTDTLDAINTIKNALTNLPRDAAAIPGILAAYTAKIADQINNDVAALAQAQLDVAQAAVASSLVSFLEDECMSQVVSAVMTQPLRNEVEKARNETTEKIFKARYGY